MGLISEATEGVFIIPEELSESTDDDADLKCAFCGDRWGTVVSEDNCTT